MYRLVGFALAALVAVVLPAASAGAQPACDDTIRDDARVLGSQPDNVRAAATLLEARGAEVRVRTVGSAGRSLSRHVAALERECASWQAPDGGRRNNLLVFVVAVDDRETGIFYGARWAPSLDREWRRITDDHMNPHFRDGDFAQGIAAGMQETERTLDSPVRVPRDGAGQAARALVVIGLLAGLTVVVVAGNRSWRRRRRREAAAEAAMEAKQAAGAAFVEMDTRWSQVRELAELLLGMLGPRDTAALRTALDDAAARVDAATNAYVTAADAYERQRRKASEQTHREAKETFTGTIETTSAANAAIDELVELETRLHQLRDELPKTLPRLRKSLSDARQLAAFVEGTGYRTQTALRDLDDVERLCSRADDLLGERELREAGEASDEASTLLDRTVTWLNNLPKLRSELEQAVQALTRRAQEAEIKIASAQTTLDAITGTYTEPSWAQVASNVTVAQGRHASCVDMLAACGRHLGMDRQEWNEAQQGRDRVEAWLDEVDHLTSAIHTLREELEEAERESPGLVETARAAVDDAARFVERHAEDVSTLSRARVAEARQALDSAAGELAASRPNYLALAANAREAASLAHAGLEQAQGEHDRMQELRRQVDVARREAEAALDRLDRYVARHRRRIRGETRTLVATAHTQWDDAQTAPDLNAAAAAYATAKNAADLAYGRAQSDVQRLHRTTGVMVGGTGSRRGGSSSWGSSGRGGGGSSSWGGSSRGGGGSSRW